MDREELLALLAAGPIRVLMNDGNTYDIVAGDESIVSDIAMYSLYRGKDGKIRTMVLPLVTMSGVEPLKAEA